MKVKKVDIGLFLTLCFASIVSTVVFDDGFIAAYCIVMLMSFILFFRLAKSAAISPIALFYILYTFFLALGPIGFYFSDGKYNREICYMILGGLAFFLFGYLISGLIPKPLRENKIFELNLNNIGTIKFVCMAILLLSMAFRLYYLFTNLSLLSLENIESGRIEASSGNGLVSVIAGAWRVAACVLYELRLNGIKIKKTTWAICCVAAILELTSGFRTSFFAYILILLLMSNKKRNFSIKNTFLCGLIMLLGLTFFKFLRSGLFGTYVIKDFLLNALLQDSYVNCINLGHILRAFPSKHDFLNGYGYLINLKMMLPGPDLDFTLTLKQILGMSFAGGGVTPTIIGELYLNFNVVGAYIGMFALGIFFNKLNSIYMKGKLYFLPSFLVVYFLLGIRTGLANSEVTIITLTIIYLFICYFTNNFRIKLR